MVKCEYRDFAAHFYIIDDLHETFRLYIEAFECMSAIADKCDDSTRLALLGEGDSINYMCGDGLPGKLHEIILNFLTAKQ